VNLPRPADRIASVDLVRGAVMLLMAIDHVRVFSGVPPGGPDPAVFFTRWVTHFCAPAFVFLAGTSAFLYAQRVEAGGGDARRELTRFLLTRGVWLVLLELTVLRLAWTFNVVHLPHAMAGVIWMLGWCMILLAALIRLPLKAVGAVGIAVIAGHDLVGGVLPGLVPALNGGLAGAWSVVYAGFWTGPIALGERASLIVLYSLVPWVGVIAAGYAFGALLMREAAARDRALLRLGLGMTAGFVLLRALDVYGDPQPWRGSDLPVPLAFLDTTKYPASLSFLLMTLGPTIALMPLVERARGAFARWVTAFGRVPFFYYLLHIPLIHALALVVSAVTLGAVSPWQFANHPMGNPPVPDGERWALGTLYAVWLVTVVLLYPACRWFAALKARRNDSWLRYL
jgi:uncharacterized membrane protein